MKQKIRKRRVGFIGLLGLLVVFGLWPGTILARSEKADASVPSTAKSEPAQPALSEDFRVGPGDVIEVSVWREPEASTTVVVRPDGKISLPLVNDLFVSGQTPMEIQQRVIEQLSPFINSPNVTIIVRQILSKKVYVIGEVHGTGAYQITQPTTILQILTQAGGLRPFAKEKSIYVLRTENGKQERFPFNYKDVVRGKNIEQNILLEPGDTIVVP